MNVTRSHLKHTLKRYRSAACAMLLFFLAVQHANAQGGPPPQQQSIATIMLDAPAKTPRPQQLQRVLQGRVLDKEGKGLAGALVFLKNTRKSSLMSVVTGEDGSFRFVQLPKSTDYQLWAEIDKKRSGAKSISSFDDSNEMRRDLTIEK